MRRMIIAALVTTIALLAGPPGSLAAPDTAVPERSRVCMMQDTVLGTPGLPIEHNGRTYFGCCPMCKAKIATEPDRFTTAIDPVSGRKVDKATAELLSVGTAVLYFESAANRARFLADLNRLGGQQPAHP